MQCASIGIRIYRMREAPNMRYIGMAGCGILSGDKATVEAALRQLLDQESEKNIPQLSQKNLH